MEEFFFRASDESAYPKSTYSAPSSGLNRCFLGMRQSLSFYPFYHFLVLALNDFAGVLHATTPLRKYQRGGGWWRTQLEKLRSKCHKE